MLLDADVLDSQTIKNVKKNTVDDDIPWNTIYQVLDDENDWKSEDVDGLYPKIPKNERSIMRTGFGNKKFKENIVEPYPHIERMRITANNPREISLYTTGEVESDGKIASPVIRGDVPGAVGTDPWLVSANINEKKRQRQFYDDLYNNKLGKFKKGGSRKTTKKSNNITKSNKTTKKIIYPLGVHLNNTELVGYIEEQPSGEVQYKTEISPGVDPKTASFMYTRTNPPSPAPIITEDFKFDAIAISHKKKGGPEKTKKNRSNGGSGKRKAAEIETNDCSICLGEMNNNDDNTAKTQCNHRFHKDCLKRWCINQRDRRHIDCPQCRANIKRICRTLTVSEVDRTLLAGIEHGEIDHVAHALQHGANVNIIDGYGTPAIIIAMEEDNKEILQLIVEHPNIDINATDRFGNVAVDIAMLNDDQEIVNILLEHGAEMDESLRYSYEDRFAGGAPIDKKKEQSYEVLKKLKKDNIIGPTEQTDLNEMFYKYSKKGDAKRVLELLLSGTINVNMVDASGNTALMIASDYGHTHLVKILLNNGTDPNIENKNGWTAIDFATGFLLEQGLNKKEVIDSQLFSLLAGAGGRPGSSFYDTRAARHMTTPPGIDDKSGGKKKTRKHHRKK